MSMTDVTFKRRYRAKSDTGPIVKNCIKCCLSMLTFLCKYLGVIAMYKHPNFTLSAEKKKQQQKEQQKQNQKHIQWVT